MNSPLANQEGNKTPTGHPDNLQEEENADIAETVAPEETPDTPTQYFVKKALHGISLKSETVSAKTPMGMFARVMEDKNSRFMEVEKEKLKLQQSQFDEEQKLKKERNEIELLKVYFIHLQLNIQFHTYIHLKHCIQYS